MLRALWRHTFAGLRRKPAQTLAAIVALGLGIGLTTALFTIARGTYLRSLPLPQADELVRIEIWSEGKPTPGISPATVEAWADSQHSLSHLVGWFAAQMILGDDGNPPEWTPGAYVPASFFAAVRVHPQLGRGITADDDQTNAPPVAVISDRLWRTRYGGDPSVIGSRVEIGGDPVTIVGVMPAGFRFPFDQDFWLPLRTVLPQAQRYRTVWLDAFARLRGGSSPAAAQAELDAIVRRSAVGPSSDGAKRRVVVTPFVASYTRSTRRSLTLMILAGVGILLIACGNVANLLLARWAAREREISIKVALGSSRRAVVGTVFSEALLLAVSGAVLGLALARWGIDLYQRFGGLSSAYWVDIRFDWEVAAIVVLTVGVVTVLSSLLPVVRAFRLQPVDSLGSAFGSDSGKALRRLGGFLVSSQVALSVALLIGTTASLLSVRNLDEHDFGAAPRQIWTAQVAVDLENYQNPAMWRRFYDAIQERVGAIPGVESVGVATNLPVGPTQRVPVEIENRSAEGSADSRTARKSVVSSSYFETLGRSPLRGRGFTRADADGPPVVLVNQSFARHYFGDEDPIGHRIRLDERGQPGAWRTILGVVPDLYLSWDYFSERLDQDHPEGVYLPIGQAPPPGVFLVARTTRDPSGLSSEVRTTLSQLAPGLDLLDPLPMLARFERGTKDYRFTATLLTVFGVAALLLAAIGLYSVVNLVTRQRFYEFGVRLVVGARRRQVFVLALRTASLQFLIGSLIGLGVSVALLRGIGSVLFGIERWDSLLAVCVVGGVALVSFVASAWPALEATRIPPAITLRAD